MVLPKATIAVPEWAERSVTLERIPPSEKVCQKIAALVKGGCRQCIQRIQHLKQDVLFGQRHCLLSGLLAAQVRQFRS